MRDQTRSCACMHACLLVHASNLDLRTAQLLQRLDVLRDEVRSPELSSPQGVAGVGGRGKYAGVTPHSTVCLCECSYLFAFLFSGVSAYGFGFRGMLCVCIFPRKRLVLREGSILYKSCLRFMFAKISVLCEGSALKATKGQAGFHSCLLCAESGLDCTSHGFSFR